MVKMTSVWDRTSDFLSESSGTVFAIAAGMIFLPLLVSGSLEGVAQPDSMEAALVGLVAFALTIVSVWGGFAITALALRSSGAGPAIGQSGRRLPILLGLSILMLLALVVLLIPFAVIIAASGVDMAAMTVPGASMPDIGAGTVIGLLGYGLLLTVLLVWVAARLAVLTPVILAERRGFGAFSRAWSLTRGHTWRIVGVLVLYGIVALVATMAVGAAAGAVGMILAGGQSGFGVGTVIIAGGTAIVSTLLSVIQSAFIGKLYLMLAPQAELEDTFA